MSERSTLVLDNIRQRYNSIKGQLGAKAYRRREIQIEMEKIDVDVAQMEAQGVLLEATLKDIQQEGLINGEAETKERADAKEARSKRAKAAAKERKRETTEKAPRKGKAASKT